MAQQEVAGRHAHAAGNQPSAPQGGKGGKNRSGRSKFWTVVFWLGLAVFVVALVGLGTVVWTYWSANDRYEQIAAEAFDKDAQSKSLDQMTVDWAKLEKINPDIVAWVFVPGTKINYPVVQGKDNDRYLNTNFDGATGLATGCGTIFLDKGDSKKLTDDNEALYGHHRNDGTMFAVISDFGDQKTFDQHRTLYFLTPKKNYQLKTFSLVRTTGTDAIMTLNFPTQKSKTKYVQDKIKRSIVTPKEGFPNASQVKHIFTFATCDYNEANGRAVLFSQVEKTAVPVTDASHTVGKYTAATE